MQGLDSSWPSGPYITQSQLHMGLLTEQSDVVKWLYSTYWALSAVTTAVYGERAGDGSRGKGRHSAGTALAAEAMSAFVVDRAGP